LADQEALSLAYYNLRDRLGPRVIVQAMAGEGIESAIGCVRDQDFGPLVMVAAGGTMIELFSDRQFALAPFDEDRALEMIDRLAVSRLLNGFRGAPAGNKMGAAKALAAFSTMCSLLRDSVVEVDVNPLIVTEHGVVAVDALLIHENAKTKPQQVRSESKRVIW
jgi:acetyltransferase